MLLTLFSQDAPIMDVYDDLAKAYPKAKVILTVREPGQQLPVFDEREKELLD